ncbi:15057_t:CDS:2 [Dentiscutata erythropus]|uniref:15057_t:CDS:1 n=1 Tax=Dentiscutata erythropus TaxID=1348616 RepID=A0A9N9NHD4_9GLOM|nr:15057_t:CDS:2 [Dentiscutata erythropus]
MPQTYVHRLTKYVHIQDELAPSQKTKRTICRACESNEKLFEKGRNEALSTIKAVRQQSNITGSSTPVSTQVQAKNSTLNNFVIRLLFVESKAFHDFVSIFNSTIKIPNCQTLSRKILVEYTERLESAWITTLLETQEPVTIMFDSWKNVCNQEVLGAIILSSTNKIYIWGAENISNTGHKTIDVLNMINAFLERAKNQNLNIIAMVTDSALFYV